jgi:hypothetical protein
VLGLVVGCCCCWLLFLSKALGEVPSGLSMHPRAGGVFVCLRAHAVCVVGGLVGINLCGGYKLFGVEEWWVVRSWGGNGDFKLPEVGW